MVLLRIDRLREVAQVVRNILRIFFFCMLPVSQAQSADSSLFGFSTDERLMSKIEKLGELEGGLIVYSWQWNKIASELDPRYGAAEVDGGLEKAFAALSDVMKQCVACHSAFKVHD